MNAVNIHLLCDIHYKVIVDMIAWSQGATSGPYRVLQWPCSAFQKDDTVPIHVAKC